MKRNRSITYYRTALERVGRALNFRPDVHRSAARLLFAVGIRDDRDMPWLSVESILRGRPIVLRLSASEMK